MNRVLKKAASFLAAVVVGASALAAGGVTASAKSGTTAAQLVGNNYDLVIGTSNAAFYVGNCLKTVETKDDWGDVEKEISVNLTSKSRFVMVNKNGKAVSVKNSIGFDKIYQAASAGGVREINLDYNSYDDTIDGQHMEGSNSCIIVGKGKKYAAILGSGKFLEKGKLFDKISTYGNSITAVSGKKTFIYDEDGKKVATINSKNAGMCISYDPASKNSLMYYVNTTGNWDDRAKEKLVIINSKGKELKTFKDRRAGSFTKINGKTYVAVKSRLYDDPEYYTVDGKKAAVGLSNAAEPNLSWNCDYNYETQKGTLTVTDKKGKVIYTVNGSAPGGEGKTDYDIGYPAVYNNGKLIIGYGNLVVIDDATGNIEYQDSKRKYIAIKYVSSDSSTFIAAYGEGKENYGYYQHFKYIVMSTKGKAISGAYDSITPVASYEPTDSFFVTSSDKIGIMNSKGKVIVKPAYDSVADTRQKVSLLKKGETCDLYDNNTGKKLLGKLYYSTSYDYYIDWGTSPFIDMTAKTTRLITTDKTGNKFGCVIIKKA